MLFITESPGTLFNTTRFKAVDSSARIVSGGDAHQSSVDVSAVDVRFGSFWAVLAREIWKLLYRRESGNVF